MNCPMMNIQPPVVPKPVLTGQKQGQAKAEVQCQLQMDAHDL